jgi:hypothetical protein
LNISPDEAEKALNDIQRMERKTRRSFAEGGAYVFLIITGTVWLVGFLATQFLTGALVAYIWTAVSLLGGALSVLLGRRMAPRVRGASASATTRRAVTFWLLLALYAAATIAVAAPTDGKRVTVLVVLFIMIGQLAMGLLPGASPVWWAPPISALVLVGYFLLPTHFYLWMAALGGGGMIGLALYLRARR